MNVITHIDDFVTGNSLIFEKEEESYSLALEEKCSMCDLLDLLLDDSRVLDYTFKVNGQNLNIKTFRYIIDWNKPHLSPIQIRKLEMAYQSCCQKVQNIFLQEEEFDEIQEHTAHLNRVIYQNASYEAFQPFISDNFSKKKWTLDELEKLSKLIALRRQKIIPYLGRFKR